MSDLKIDQLAFSKMETQPINTAKIFNKFIVTISPLINPDNLALIHSKYCIKEFKIHQINESIARNIYTAIVARNRRCILQRSELNWLQNELRMFVWILVYYFFAQDIQIQNFRQTEWEFFHILFPNKRKILFQYQAYNLLKNHNQYKKWSQEEDELFYELIKADQYRLKWSELGKTLFIESQRRYFRTPKQCRERWLNHLDPSKKKKCWLEQQDFVLIQHVKLFGKKWAKIAKKLENRRNQHSIKNRFKSLMNKESKLFSEEASQKEIIDSLYCKMLSNKTQYRMQQQQSLQVQQSKKYKQNKSQEYFLMEEDKPQQSIFNYFEDQSEMLDKHNFCSTQILCSRFVNCDHPETEQKIASKKETILQKNNVFQFGLIAENGDLKNDEVNKKSSSQRQNQAEKKVRTDLFLQEDPLYMLKSYLYKSISLYSLQ